MAAGERDQRTRSTQRSSYDGKGKGGPSYGDPHTVPVVGIEADVRPIGEDGGNRTRDTEIQRKRAYVEAGTSIPRERVWSESPSRLAEEGKGQDANARGGSFTPFRRPARVPA